MIDKIKSRLGIAQAIEIYDNDIQMYIEDCKQDMIASGVDEALANSEREDVLTAITLYVNAYWGSDRTDTEKYLDLYQRKVFRLTLEE